MPFWPTIDIVAVELLRTVPEFDPTKVNTQLPKEVTSWANGFVQVLGIGGTPGRYNPLHSPIVEVHTWAGISGGGRPPWLMANQLIEHVKALCLSATFPKKLLFTTYGDYYPARVNTAFFITGPRRIPNDDGSYAHYSGDMQVNWTPIAPIG